MPDCTTGTLRGRSFSCPSRGGRPGSAVSTSLYAIDLDGARDAYAEVIEIRLCGGSIAHPASVVLPLLVADLPVFCRWRGAAGVGVVAARTSSSALRTGSWSTRPSGTISPRAYARVGEVFERIAVSDIAFSRTVDWRSRLAELWPAIAGIERLRVEGPKADALLMIGWLRSRLRREIALTHRRADTVRTVAVDGEVVPPPVGDVASGSDLLSAELDVFGRDPVYEAAVRAA